MWEKTEGNDCVVEERVEQRSVRVKEIFHR